MRPVGQLLYQAAMIVVATKYGTTLADMINAGWDANMHYLPESRLMQFNIISLQTRKYTWKQYAT